ncbi:hypothetical protein Q8F55_006140 [Vanrija albida]|uniref:Signal transduction histidine kinase dimerisation/phosphoacceptor domain-containing protein n=1 Tax=Vanrija albida TaxID=181172 RepID=A0ABR3PWB1_9TREE
MPATDTSATVTVADVEKAQGARQTRFDDEVQTAPGARVAWWARVGQCVRHGMSAATAAMHWSENRTSSASSSSGATSGTGSREGRPSPMRRSTQSTVASGPGERANDDTHDPTPVNLVVVDFATAPEPAEAGAESDSLSEHTETPVASRYTARSGDHSNPVVVAALWMKNVLVRKGWPLFKSYCDSSFPDKHQESVFQHELWYVDKRPALLCSLSLIAEFALILGLMTPKNDFWSYWGYVVIVGGFTLPVPLMILFNGPRRFSWIYQTFLLGAGWSLGFMATIELYHCLRENRDNMSICGTGGAIVFITGPLFALPTLTLMAMRQNRMLNLFMAMTYLVFSSITVSVAPNNALASARTLFTVALYFVILTYLNYTREQGQRQMFVMRYELKRQCKTAQLAQEMERRANQSKKRFVSYIFHEVRVPLNTALLAVQNLEGEGVFKNLSEDHSEMIYGLMGSLTIMEKASALVAWH